VNISIAPLLPVRSGARAPELVGVLLLETHCKTLL
jgi:hypothetical protein